MRQVNTSSMEKAIRILRGLRLMPHERLIAVTEVAHALECPHWAVLDSSGKFLNLNDFKSTQNKR